VNLVTPGAHGVNSFSSNTIRKGCAQQCISPGALNFSSSETVCFDVKPQIIIVRFYSRPTPMHNQANTPGEAVTKHDSVEVVVENNGGE
jgi:hypothetical protein